MKDSLRLRPYGLPGECSADLRWTLGVVNAILACVTGEPSEAIEAQAFLSSFESSGSSGEELPVEVGDATLEDLLEAGLEDH